MGVSSLKIKSKKNLVGQIITGALITALLCTIIIPSLSRCFENADVKKCTRDMKNIISTFEKALNSGTNTDKWKSLLAQKKSQQLLSEITPLMPPEQQKTDLEDYYFENDGNTVKIICKKHDKIKEEISFVLPDVYSFDVAASPVSKTADALIVSGIKNYAKGTSIDVTSTDKMVFGTNDNLNSLFPSIEVYSIAASSKSTLLNNEDYTITAPEPIDMSQSGTKTLTINYKSNNAVWANTLSASFNFEVLEKTECAPLQAKFKNTKYDIEAWNWNDFVTATSNSSETQKSFGPALILFNTHYYYYPNGFLVDKTQDNSSPLNFAFDKDAPAITANYIEVFPKKTISSPNSSDDEDTDGGSITVINDEFFVYQKKTRAQDGGWVKMYTKASKAPVATEKPKYTDDDDD